jgi:glycosyltransferase involved in cell wall biosynthesis
METWSYRLSEELRKLRPVQIVALPGEATGKPPRKRRLLLFPFMVMQVWLARKSRPRILQIGDLALWPIGLLARSGTRVFIAAHGTDAAYHRRGGVRGTLYGLYLRLGAGLLRNASVIANSEATRKVLAETGWHDAEVVLLGTDFRPPQTVKQPTKRILFAGRLVARKGCGWFVREVLPLLPDEIVLDIAGTAWDKSESRVLEHPRVRLLGNLDQTALAEAYAGALCVIIPNIAVPSGEFEGFGLVAPEAAAAGAVVLAADRDGLRDAVVDGVTGYLIESGNPDAWAAKIVEVAGWDAERRKGFCEGASAYVQEHFNWPRVARQFCAIFDRAP